MIAVADAPPLWLPPKPSIIRPAEHSLLKPGAFRPMTGEERKAVIADLVRSKRMTFAEARRAMFFVPAMIPKPLLPTLANTYLATTSGGSTATITFSSVPLGTGLVIIGITNGSGTSGRNASSVTANGNSCTFVQRVERFASGYEYHSELWQVSNPGASGSVVVAWNGAVDSCFITVWNATNLLSTTATTTPSSSVSSTSTSVSIVVPAGGFGLALFQQSGTTATWTGLTSLTTSGNALQAAQLVSPGGATVTAGVTISGTNRIGLLGAAWR